jgi:hypothetical protein
MQHRQLPVITG